MFFARSFADFQKPFAAASMARFGDSHQRQNELKAASFALPFPVAIDLHIGSEAAALACAHRRVFVRRRAERMRSIAELGEVPPRPRRWRRDVSELRAVRPRREVRQRRRDRASPCRPFPSRARPPLRDLRDAALDHDRAMVRQDVGVAWESRSCRLRTPLCSAAYFRGTTSESITCAIRAP